jgi:hypothetical protein
LDDVANAVAQEASSRLVSKTKTGGSVLYGAALLDLMWSFACLDLLSKPRVFHLLQLSPGNIVSEDM